jgi:carbon-monoxide dehydrogenase large subunit
MAHDSGRLINPLVVDGQVQGACAHGIGNALFERLIYSDDGQPLTTTFAEYLLPTAPEVPPVGVIHVESPTPINPLGVKGAGEGGTIPALAAVVAAVEDALSPYGVRIDEVPITPGRIVQLVSEARRRSAA